MQPVPVGVPGELYIGGVCLARGYHNRPDLNAERFIADPFSDDPGARLYKTGDEAKYLPHGAIEYIGRLDQQVKIRGHRVELGDIEARLAEHPDIAACAVYATEDHQQQLQIVACIVKRKPDRYMAVKELYDYLKDRMPESMIPARWMFIQEMPLTASGKLDRKALPQSDRSDGIEQNALFHPPTDQRQQTLLDIWEQVLQISAPSIKDSFFHLGGNSLLAIQLMARVEQEFARKLPVSSLLEHDTIERLAGLLSNDQAEGQKPSALVALSTSGSHPPLFCIHPVGGSVVCYNAFPQALGGDRPVYAIQAEQISGISDGPPSSIQEMAHQYIRRIRTVQPEGPYSLLGWSYGGIVAHEMACELRKAGQAVGMLALLDARLKPQTEDEPEFSENEWKQHFLHDFAGVQRMGEVTEVREEAWSPGEDGYNRFYNLFKANFRAMYEHVPQWFDGTLVWFRAKEEEEALTLDCDWSSYAKQVDSILLDGDHYSIMSAPNVGRIAAYLKSDNHEAKESV